MKKIILFITSALFSCITLFGQETEPHTINYLTHNNFNKIARYIMQTGDLQKDNLYRNDKLIQGITIEFQDKSGKDYLFIYENNVKDIRIFRIGKSSQKILPMNYECSVEEAVMVEGIYNPLPEAQFAHKMNNVNFNFKQILSEIKRTPGIPKFKDPEVQQMVKEYASFIIAIKMNDSTKITELTKKGQDWIARYDGAMQKLSKDADEMEKFSRFMLTILDSDESDSPQFDPLDDEEIKVQEATEPVDTIMPSGEAIPIFKDAEVQQMVNEYAVLLDQYCLAIENNDANKRKELRKKGKEWEIKYQGVMEKLSLDEKELKRFIDFIKKSKSKNS